VESPLILNNIEGDIFNGKLGLDPSLDFNHIKSLSPVVDIGLFLF
jgi:hypothetical protein